MRQDLVRIFIGAVVGTLASCTQLRPIHCVDQQRDLTCMRREDSRPFCSTCVLEFDGCVEERVQDERCIPKPVCASSARGQGETPNQYCTRTTDGTEPYCNACAGDGEGCVDRDEAVAAAKMNAACIESGPGSETTDTGFTESGPSTSVTDGTAGSTSEDPECETDEHCTGHPDGPACGPAHMCVECTASNDSACEHGTSVCDTSTNMCVGCVTDDHCLDATLAHCNDGNICEACTDQVHCAHLGDKPICKVGVCVECLDEDDCGGNFCDRENLVCTDDAPGSAGLCEPCIATAHCAADMACVKMIIDGVDTGYFCQWLTTTPAIMFSGCSDVKPFAYETTKPTREGGMADVCSLRFASCEAYHHMIAGQPCDEGQDDDCGIMTVNDGRCFGTVCSIECMIEEDCPQFIDCPYGVCE